MNDPIEVNDKYLLLSAENFEFSVLAVHPKTVLLKSPKGNRILVSKETLEAQYIPKKREQ